MKHPVRRAATTALLVIAAMLASLIPFLWPSHDRLGPFDAVIVTSTPHLTRSRLLFRRCLKGSVIGVAAWPPYGRDTWIGAVRHEWLGTADALAVHRGC